MSDSTNRSVMLGIPVDHVNMTDALERIMTMVDEYEVDGKNRLVATANVDFIVNSHDNKQEKIAEELRSTLRNADMVTADGMPLVWLSQMLGRPLEERVTGADMVPALAEKAAREGKSIYFFGGIDGSAKQTAQILSDRYPGLKVAGYSAPMIDLDDEIENKIEIARINITEPDILLIALGNPKQELWFNRFKRYLKVPVSMGIGGTFEFIAGMTSRAPEWMQRVGLEWIYRMTQDPKRLVRRYIKGLYTFNRMTLPLILMNTVAKRFRNSGPAFSENQFNSSMQTSDSEQAIWQNIRAINGLDAGIELLSGVKILNLDFSQIRSFSSEDISKFMNVFLEVQRENMFCLVSGLRWLPNLLFRLYRINDLLDAVALQVVEEVDEQYSS